MGKDPRRIELHQILKDTFNSTPHVYYQPPASVQLKYPCIVYSLNDFPEVYADNDRYLVHRPYQVTVIDQDPDSELRENVAKLRWCRFDRSYVSDNLNHFVFTLTY